MQVHKIIVNGQARLAFGLPSEPKRVSYRRPVTDGIRSELRKNAMIDPNFQRGRNLIINQMLKDNIPVSKTAKVFGLTKTRIFQMKKQLVG